MACIAQKRELLTARRRGVESDVAWQIADALALHPEYHALIDSDDALQRDFAPADGQINPFLHLSLHLALTPVETPEDFSQMQALRGAVEAEYPGYAPGDEVDMDDLEENLFDDDDDLDDLDFDSSDGDVDLDSDDDEPDI